VEEEGPAGVVGVAGADEEGDGDGCPGGGEVAGVAVDEVEVKAAAIAGGPGLAALAEAKEGRRREEGDGGIGLADGELLERLA
jgi:hypothetical protein